MVLPLVSDLLGGMPMAALLIGRDETLLGANREADALLGPVAEGRHFATLLRQPPVIEALESVLSDQKPRLTRHLDSEVAQDTVFDVHCRYIEAMDAVLVSFQDVTPLEQAGQMRRDFVANVSHELRTPLTALSGFIETLQGAARNDPEAQERFLGIMEGEAARMNRLVGDLLSLNRVESEQRVRPGDNVDLSALLRATLSSIEPLAKRSGVDLILSGTDKPVPLIGDKDQLQQVFANLIENAIKYGGSGGRVEITIKLLDHDTALRGPAARVEVADFGPGIDQIHLPRLTERFYRADSHRSRNLGGTGLGLAIVKHIVSRHRGHLRVDSQPGKGATFTVLLPR